MNENEIKTGISDSSCGAEPEKLPYSKEDIEIDGDVFHIEEFEPTEEEYRELVGGLYKSFYDNDLKAVVEAAVAEQAIKIRAELEAEAQIKEQSIKDEARREIIKRISQRRLRPDENGLSGRRVSPKRDVSKMTKEERALAAKRAANGLIINFK